MAIDGVPKDLALSFKEAVKCELFIETGTYKAFTAFWARDNFKRTITTELDGNRWRRNEKHIETNPTIEFLQGNSGDLLPDILKAVNEPVIFWLDAHGLNNPLEETFDKTECPLMAELEAIQDWFLKAKQPHLILIDDARLFLAPPPLPWNPARWPSIVQIESYLNNYTIYIVNDVIIAVKEQQKGIVDKWVESKLA